MGIRAEPVRNDTQHYDPRILLRVASTPVFKFSTVGLWSWEKTYMIIPYPAK